MRTATVLAIVAAYLFTTALCYDWRDLKVHGDSGFKISLFAGNITNARGLAMSPNGTIFVGSMNLFNGEDVAPSNIYALVDTNGDHVADQVYVIAQNLSFPVGLDWYNGNLYYTDITDIYVLENIDANLANPPAPQLFLTFHEDIPEINIDHSWKYLRFHNDSMYYAIGSPCNVCNMTMTGCLVDFPDQPCIFGTMNRIDMKTSPPQVVTLLHGMRNSVGFDWHPLTGDLWWTDNGRDELGDNIPPDELNMLPANATGAEHPHYGFPWCFSVTTDGATASVADPTMSMMNPLGSCAPFVPAKITLPPHGAAIGMRFLTSKQFPAHYTNKAIIALHGSWDRTVPSGYEVILADVEKLTYETFITGFLQLPKNFTSEALGPSPYAWGRPVDFLQLPDGSVLISDDTNNAVYRLSYHNTLVYGLTPALFYSWIALGSIIVVVLLAIPLAGLMMWRRRSADEYVSLN